MEKDLAYRSEFLVEVFKDWIDPDYSILEIGYGDGRNLRALAEAGYTHVKGIDKNDGTAIETWPESHPDAPPQEPDVIFSMSCFFLIPPENNWVFEKIAKMAKRYIITIEGEDVGHRMDLFNRNYGEVFKEFGFKEMYSQRNVFNDYGVLRVLKRDA